MLISNCCLAIVSDSSVVCWQASFYLRSAKRAVAMLLIVATSEGRTQSESISCYGIPSHNLSSMLSHSRCDKLLQCSNHTYTEVYRLPVCIHVQVYFTVYGRLKTSLTTWPGGKQVNCCSRALLQAAVAVISSRCDELRTQSGFVMSVNSSHRQQQISAGAQAALSSAILLHS